MQKYDSPLVLLLRKLRVRTRLLIFMIITLLVISNITMLFSRHLAQRIADQYVYEYLHDEHNRLINSLELYLEEIIMLSLRYKNTSAFYDTLQDSSLSYSQKEAALQKTAQSIRQSVSVGNIYLVGNDSQVYLLHSQNPDLPAPDPVAAASRTSYPYYNVDDIIRDENGKCYLSLSMQFYNFYTSQNGGYLIIYLPLNTIADMYNDLLIDSGVTFITDESGLILSHSDPEQIGKTTEELHIPIHDKNFSVSHIDSDGQTLILVSTAFTTSKQLIGFHWRLSSIFPSGELFMVLNQILFATLLASVIIIVIACIISFLLSKRMTSSLKQLHAKIISFGHSQTRDFLTPTHRDELWDLEQGYNEMVMRIYELLEKNKEEQEKKRELELTALQAQINPHFLYNTLDAIGWMAALKGQDEIEQMVMALARFFRLSLHKGDKKIPIADEVSIVESYIAIEQLRNPGKFDVIYDIQPEITHILVPKIILQPIVENAIKHGVSQVRRHGVIHIQGYRENDDVILKVTDNGKGFQTKTDQLHPSGYGMTNVNERIQLEYGKKYGVSFQSEPEKGSTVTIHVCFESPQKNPLT